MLLGFYGGAFIRCKSKRRRGERKIVAQATTVGRISFDDLGFWTDMDDDNFLYIWATSRYEVTHLRRKNRVGLAFLPP